MNQSKLSVPGIVITLLIVFSFMAISTPLWAVTKKQAGQQRADIQKMAN